MLGPHAILFSDAARQDLRALDRHAQLRVLKKVFQLSDNPMIGSPLGNRSASRLVGYRKLKLKQLGIRVVYQVKDDIDGSGSLGTRIVLIGERDDDWCYTEAQERVSSLPDEHPLGEPLGELLESLGQLRP